MAQLFSGAARHQAHEVIVLDHASVEHYREQDPTWALSAPRDAAYE